MKILNVSEIKQVCKKLFGTSSIANVCCGYVLRNYIYLGVLDSWFKIDMETDTMEPVNLDERHIILASMILAHDNGLVAEVCESFLEESTGSIANDFVNALKEWDLV